ncbi:uracil DNA glycosylase a isoform X2 [Carcharodon carcharias]|uniref:uracil DNA glycosylase a isoform X2 n=1 Tax=Carcharodon carcharias TaxID=13397 RepID=UPI001B7E1D20|nr:uracil DNA glycosylase a isoform X2 [Carcharodon carcharias]
MIGQKTIASYFGPAAKKRTLSEVSEEENENEKETNQEEQQGGLRTPVKKPRAGPGGEEAASPPSSPLSPEQLSRIERNKQAALQRLAARNVPPGFGESWKRELLVEFSKPYFSRLMGFVAMERKRYMVYPPPHEVFTWTEICNFHDVKVVILGQDPYHGPKQAHGLCFSVKRPVLPPPSLENMYKELQWDIEGFEPPQHGDLTGWAKQEASPCPADGSPLPPLCTPRLLRLQALLQNQRAAEEIGEDSHQLEVAVSPVRRRSALVRSR